MAIGLNVNGKIQPVAVGCTLLSSDEIIANKFQGKGIQTIHVIKDSLWLVDFKFSCKDCNSGNLDHGVVPQFSGHCKSTHLLL